MSINYWYFILTLFLFVRITHIFVMKSTLHSTPLMRGSRKDMWFMFGWNTKTSPWTILQYSLLDDGDGLCRFDTLVTTPT